VPHATSERIPFGTPEFWLYAGICLGLVLVAGVMSGLTVGYSSIDPLRLSILKESTDESDALEKARATIVERVTDDHHKLLVTLLLTNAAAMEALPVFLDRLFPSYIAIILSVTFVLFFGEVIPQALCTKSPLKIGATWAPFIETLMLLECPITYPISKLLDWILGHDGKRYLFRRSELATLIGMHSKRRTLDGELEEVDEVRIIQGALQLRDTTVQDAMTPKDSIYMLDINTILNETVMVEIMARGHSRIPVFRSKRQNIVGMLLIKNLILLDPEEEIPVSQLLARKPLAVAQDMNLYDMLNLFQRKHCHLAVVLKDRNHLQAFAKCMREEDNDVPDAIDIMGIITIEDVIEDLIQEEIYDETDDTRNVRLAQGTFNKWKNFVAQKKLGGTTGQKAMAKALKKFESAGRRARRRTVTKAYKKELQSQGLLETPVSRPVSEQSVPRGFDAKSPLVAAHTDTKTYNSMSP